jgi:GxxExxY protein
MMGTKLIYPELSYQIIGACLDVYMDLGPGCKEVHYQKGLGLHLAQRGLSYSEHPFFPIRTLERHIGSFIPDFIIDHKIILEIKVGEKFEQTHFTQVKNYLLNANLPLGILVRFGSHRVTSHRILKPNN